MYLLNINVFIHFLAVCSLLRLGVAAVFGPQSAQISSHVQSICDTMEIPHLETRWDYKLRRESCLVNLYPHPTVLSKVTLIYLLWFIVLSLLPYNVHLYNILGIRTDHHNIIYKCIAFNNIIYSSRRYIEHFTYLGVLGFGEKMGLEVVHDNIREQRRPGEAARAVESQERRTVGVPDHDSSVGLRSRSQVNII